MGQETSKGLLKAMQEMAFCWVSACAADLTAYFPQKGVMTVRLGADPAQRGQRFGSQAIMQHCGRVADRAMRSLHEAFETVLQFLEVAAAEPERLASPLALAAVRTLGRCVLGTFPSLPTLLQQLATGHSHVMTLRPILLSWSLFCCCDVCAARPCLSLLMWL